MVILRRVTPFLSWLTPPFSYGRRWFRQIILEAAVRDIKVEVDLTK